MKITNMTKTDIGLQPEMIVPAMGSLDVDNNTLTKLKSLPSVKDHFVYGRLTEDGAVEAPEDALVDSDRAAIIAGIIRGLPEAEYTKGGKPEVDAINAAMVKGAEPVTAAERDAVWEGMSA